MPFSQGRLGRTELKVIDKGGSYPPPPFVCRDSVRCQTSRMHSDCRLPRDSQEVWFLWGSSHRRKRKRPLSPQMPTTINGFASKFMSRRRIWNYFWFVRLTKSELNWMCPMTFLNASPWPRLGWETGISDVPLLTWQHWKWWFFTVFTSSETEIEVPAMHLLPLKDKGERSLPYFFPHFPCISAL